MNKYIFSIIACTTLISCSQTYEVHSNVAPSNFKDYFKPSQVKIVEPAQVPAGTRSLAAISGSSCQVTETDKPANMTEARTQAKIAAAELGANGLVIDVCETQLSTELPKCHKLLTCYGRAIQLDEQP